MKKHKNRCQNKKKNYYILVTGWIQLYISFFFLSPRWQFTCVQTIPVRCKMWTLFFYNFFCQMHRTLAFNLFTLRSLPCGIVAMHTRTYLLFVKKRNVLVLQCHLFFKPMRGRKLKKKERFPLFFSRTKLSLFMGNFQVFFHHRRIRFGWILRIKVGCMQFFVWVFNSKVRIKFN